MMNRSGFVTVALASAVTAILTAACATTRGGVAPETSSSTYARIGEDARFTRRCYAPQENRTPKCDGYPPVNLGINGSDDPELLNWLASPERWEKASTTSTRVATKGRRTSNWRVQSIKNPHKFKFALHDTSAFVIARIIADPTGPIDSLYGIGSMPATMDSTFFVVVRGFDASDLREPPRAGLPVNSRKISRWSIYGIDRSGTTPRVVKVGNEGDIRWCGHPHPGTFLDKKPAAKFQFCKPAPQALQEPGSLAMMPLDPPLWFTCGLGCCTADFEL